MFLKDNYPRLNQLDSFKVYENEDDAGYVVDRRCDYTSD